MEHSISDKDITEFAHFLLENRSTIRATAKAFGLAKSTLHNYLSTRLKRINYPLYEKVQELLDENFSVKHLHGGESTKHKYAELKKEINKYEEVEALMN